MKTKTILFLFLLMSIGMTQLSAQTIKKGAMIAIKTYVFTLQPDVTMNQFQDFWINKYIPEVEKCYPGLKIFLMKANRGDRKNQFGEIWYLESLQLRDKYWPTEADEATSEYAKAAEEKLKPINDEVGKLVLPLVLPGITGGSTDWIVM